MFAWWTRNGFVALLTTIGVFGLFGAVVTFAFGDAIFDRFRWLWGIGWLLAAIVTWLVGRRMNGRPLNPLRFRTFKEFRRAPHRFCSFAIEAWALPQLAAAVFQIIRGLLPMPPLDGV